MFDSVKHGKSARYIQNRYTEKMDTTFSKIIVSKYIYMYQSCVKSLKCWNEIQSVQNKWNGKKRDIHCRVKYSSHTVLAL